MQNKCISKISPGLLMLLMLPFFVFSQDPCDSLMEKCVSKLGQNIFIKSFHVKLGPGYSAGNELEQPVVMSKKSTYLISVADLNQKKKRLIVELYDMKHNFLASTYDKKGNKFYETMEFSCSSSGIYFIKASAQSESGVCGAIAVGFNNKMNSDDYLDKGINEMSINDYKSAIKSFDKLILDRPDYDIGYFMRGKARFKLENYKEALDDLNMAIKLNPDEPEPYYYRGQTKFMLSDAIGACEDWQQSKDLGSPDGMNEFRKNCK